VPALGWTAGIAAARVDSFPWQGLPWLAAAAAIALCRRRLRPFALALLAGTGWGAVTMLADASVADVDPLWTSASRCVVADVVRSRRGAATRLTLAHVRGRDGIGLDGNAWLYVYGRKGTSPHAGDHIRACAHWHRPRNHNNPGAFDFASYCFDRRIALIGGARGALTVLASHPGLFERLRERIRQALAPLPETSRAVLAALLLADRSRIPVHLIDAFAATGTAHLLAISGLHVGMTGALGFALCWWFLTRREAWIVALPVRALALTAGVLSAVTYASLAGWPLPAQRAALMLAAGLLAWWLRLRATPLNTLLGAWMMILAWDAPAISSASLWLSFCATAAILAWSHRRSPQVGGPAAWLQGLLAVTVLASLATLPLITALFGLLPLYALPANLLMVPLYSLLVLPLALAASLFACLGLGGAATALFSLAAVGIEAGNRLLLGFMQLPAAKMWLPAVPWWDTLIYIAGLGAAFMLWRHRRRLAVVTVAVALIAYGVLAAHERRSGTEEFIAWDVGQGAASTLLTGSGKVLVVDAPGRKGSRFNGGTVVASGLRALGLTHVDVLAITHAQSDHMGGALRLMQQVNSVRELWLADVPAVHAHPLIRALQAAVRRHGGRVRWLHRGENLRIDTLSCSILWPPARYSPANPNNASLVLSLRLSGGGRLLLPGDIEAGAERRLLATGLSRHSVLLLPHHGSNTSSSPGFVTAVHPQEAIAQTGFGNRYGFPAAPVVNRYRAAGAHLWNTARAAVILDWARRPSGRVRGHYAAPVRSLKRERALQWWRRLDNLRRAASGGFRR